MARTTAIPEHRPLSAQEMALVRWMLEHGTDAAVKFLPQLADVRVVSRCYWGCASVDFAVGGVVPPPGDRMGILADFEYRTDVGHMCGAFVFERAGLLGGLEVYSMDGLYTPTTLPTTEQLQPLGSIAPA
jgi:hypothetical protein